MPAIRSKALGGGRDKTSKVKKPPEQVAICLCCGAYGDKYFYSSRNVVHKNLAKLPYCKTCIDVQYQKYAEKYKDTRLAIFYTCRKFDIYFDNNAYEGALSQASKKGSSVIAIYMKQINSFAVANSYGDCFDESSEFLDRVMVKASKVAPDDSKLSERAIKDKEDVLLLLGYNPFEFEDEEDKGAMYSKLVDFLDEETLGDSFKVPIVIEIVKGFNQVEGINKAINKLNQSTEKVKASEIKDLMTTKQNMIKAILAMAKDNGISINHSNNKSKGAGTLSGIIKDLNEKGIARAQVNVYDIETAEGMRQVADISNKSILNQLMLNENDYTDMIKTQREMIQKLTTSSEDFTEKYRLAQIKIKELESMLSED